MFEDALLIKVPPRVGMIKREIMGSYSRAVVCLQRFLHEAMMVADANLTR